MDKVKSGDLQIPIRGKAVNSEASQIMATQVKVSRKDPRSYISSTVVTIEIGASGRRFSVHEALLSTYSSWFRNWISAGPPNPSHYIHLKEAREDDFNTVVHWLYGGSLNNMYPDAEYDFVPIAIRLYRLGHVLDIPAFMDAIADALRKKFRLWRQSPTTRCIIDMNKYSLLGTPLGQFFIECAARRVHLELEEKRREKTAEKPTEKEERESQKRQMEELCSCPEAATEVLRLVVGREDPTWKDPVYTKGCAFHHHREGEPCHIKQVATASKGEASQDTKPSEDSDTSEVRRTSNSQFKFFEEK